MRSQTSYSTEECSSANPSQCRGNWELGASRFAGFSAEALREIGWHLGRPLTGLLSAAVAVASGAEAGRFAGPSAVGGGIARCGCTADALGETEDGLFGQG